MADNVRRAMERLSKIFDRTKVEPIIAYEVGSREEGRFWIELRHNGEDDGRGVVGWKLSQRASEKKSLLFKPLNWSWNMGESRRRRPKTFGIGSP
jgi:hypothetical protein